MKRVSFRKRIKTLAVLLTAAMLCAAAGCAGEAAVPETGTPPSSKPVATPTPEPKGIEAVLGRQITIALFSGAGEETSELFIQGAQYEAKSLGVTLETAAGNSFGDAVSGAAEADAVITYLPEPADYGAIESAAADIPVTMYGIEKASVSERVSQIFYSPGNEIDLAFNAALVYPPHDTPVRLILLFESADSAAYTAYRKLYGEGKIFPKEVYIASEAQETLGAWLTGKLDSYVEGMIDGVFAENADLAVVAQGALEALGRKDMEVFCVGATPEAIACMAASPEVFAQAAGADEYLAGALCVRASLKAIKGEGSVSQELKPCVINAAGLSKGGDAALMDMGGEQSALLSEPWMETLRSYYETIPG